MSGKHLVASGRRSFGQRALIAIGSLLTFVLLLSAAGASYLNVRFGQISRFDVAIDQAESGTPRNYLLVGSDTRDGLDPDDPEDAQFFDDEGTFTEGTVQRTDTIMILRVDPDAGEAYLLSLPRDLWVPISDTGERNRINVAYSRGRDVLVDTIRQNFDIPITTTSRSTSWASVAWSRQSAGCPCTSARRCATTTPVSGSTRPAA